MDTQKIYLSKNGLLIFFITYKKKVIERSISKTAATRDETIMSIE